MARQKKIKTLQIDQKPEENMTDSVTLENLETEIDKARLELENTKKEIEEKKNQIISMAKRELTEDEKYITEKQITVGHENAAVKAKIEKQKAFDSVMVRGKFINRRAPGQRAKLTYLKYDTDPVKWYVFEDGKAYTIPRGFADQINEHYYTPAFTQKGPDHVMNPSNPESVIHNIDTSNKKYAFTPIDF